MKVTLLGYGDIASRVAPRLLSAGHEVTGLCRRRMVQAPLSLRMVTGDCRDEETLNTLIDGQDALVYTLTPASFDETGYRASYIAAAHAVVSVWPTLKHPPRQIFWISSTSVYGQQQGEWVDEASTTAPQGVAGRCLLEAEQALVKASLPVTIIRFSGIYGPGRERLIKQVIRGDCVPADSSIWTNRIHSEDCAGVLFYLLEHWSSGKDILPLYVATDCEPALQHEVQQWLATELKVPFLVSQAPDQGRSHRGNRRCDNRRLLESGFRFQYPTFREGYRQVLATSNRCE